MTEDEMIEILEQIARNEESYPRDRIAAVKVLDEMERKRRAEAVEPDPLFAELDGGELPRYGVNRAKNN
jgi:hypothetical protein